MFLSQTDHTDILSRPWSCFTCLHAAASESTL